MGSGNPDAAVMFVGEAPGFHEDKQGVPFVGQAGKLLDTLLGEIGLDRSDVYIANVLKCRPPGNRDPLEEEIAACEGHLFKQVELIRPQVICTLGNFATKLLTGRPHGITRVRGSAQPHRIAGVDLVIFPIYHPAAALYTPSMLDTLRDDIRRLPELLNARPGGVRAARRARGAGSRAGGGARARVRSAGPVLASPQTASAAARVAAVLEPGDVVGVSGEMGAGKTTFVQAACAALGVTDAVTSPTYTVGHRYSSPHGAVSHLDLYRSSGVTDEEWADLEPYFESSICFVEWPEAGAGVLPTARIGVTIRITGVDARLIVLDPLDSNVAAALDHPFP